MGKIICHICKKEAIPRLSALTTSWCKKRHCAFRNCYQKCKEVKNK